MTLQEIASHYPDEWVAMLPKDNSVRDLHPEHRGLRVLLHSKNVHEFDKSVFKHHEYGHSFRVYITFTGTAPPRDYDLTADVAAGKMVAIELELLQEGARRCRSCRRLVYPVVTRSGQSFEWARYKLYWDCRCGTSGWVEVGFDWHEVDWELEDHTSAFEIPDHLALRRTALAGCSSDHG